MKTCKNRKGITLIELLVVLLIVGLLVALILNAVQESRKSAQKIVCTSNLKQIGVAVLQYDSTYNSLPPSRLGIGYSWLVAILPQLEQTQLFNSINLVSSNNTLISMKINVFNCPSDNVEAKITSPTHYAGNYGSGIQKFGFDGIFHQDKTIQMASLTDGSSTTSLAAEWLPNISESVFPKNAMRTILRTKKTAVLAEEFDGFVKECQNLDFSSAEISNILVGRPWTHGHLAHTLYNHSTKPFENRCLNGSAVQQGAYPPSSLHGSSLNLLFADGHVTMIQKSVSMPVWRAIGTRQGHDLVEGY